MLHLGDYEAKKVAQNPEVSGRYFFCIERRPFPHAQLKLWRFTFRWFCQVGSKKQRVETVLAI